LLESVPANQQALEAGIGSSSSEDLRHLVKVCRQDLSGEVQDERLAEIELSPVWYLEVFLSVFDVVRQLIVQVKNNDKFNSGEPGIGLEVAKWCIDKGVCMTGADTWATEVVPNPNKDLAFPVHQELICKNGIYNHENLDFTGLIADRKYHQGRHGIKWRPDRGHLSIAWRLKRFVSRCFPS
jgi:hypothetical protein